MSLFGMGPSMMGGLPLDPEKIAAAENGMNMLQSLHQDIIDGCQKKCFAKHFADAEMSKGETCCVDRCASKFFRANLLVGQHLRDLAVTPDQLSAPAAVLPTLGQHGSLR